MQRLCFGSFLAIKSNPSAMNLLPYIGCRDGLTDFLGGRAGITHEAVGSIPEGSNTKIYKVFWDIPKLKYVVFTILLPSDVSTIRT